MRHVIGEESFAVSFCDDLEVIADKRAAKEIMIDCSFMDIAMMLEARQGLVRQILCLHGTVTNCESNWRNICRSMITVSVSFNND